MNAFYCIQGENIQHTVFEQFLIVTSKRLMMKLINKKQTGFPVDKARYEEIFEKQYSDAVAFWLLY
eukprot:snap_masked-scaffold_29-processed-gene-2.38-mRNA-1 protein AED:1.00 eAED:1.00 QI:0/0/0/0/1/1/3/0/65